MRKFLEILQTIAGIIIAIVVIAAVVGLIWFAIQIFIDVLQILSWLGGGDPLMGGAISVAGIFGLILIVLFGF